MIENKQNCAELTAKILSEMKLDNYSYKVTSRSVNYIYRALNEFAAYKKADELIKKLISYFVKLEKKLRQVI